MTTCGVNSGLPKLYIHWFEYICGGQKGVVSEQGGYHHLKPMSENDIYAWTIYLPDHY